MSHVIVWDIETIPDLKGFAAAKGFEDKNDADVRKELGRNFQSTFITPSSASAL